MALAPHAVHRLYEYRKSISTKPFGARGKKLIRCPLCLLGAQFCTCSLRRQLTTQASFLLIMYNDEVIKPTNSGRLIADLIPDTYAFLWSRTEPAAEMLALLSNEHYQPFLVFPAQYANPDQTVLSQVPMATLGNGKRPLLIMLDGSWREAIKMFRKSAYLQDLPILSFDPNTLATYALRKGSHDFQLGTAEVASLALAAMGEAANGKALTAWFDLFVESSLLGRNRRCREDILPISEFTDAFEAAYRAATLEL
ncbi:tRNA-uridine aminocarboxypropyltransferase [Shewanella xiamenensis]|uniref:tRNA-uridine aminocarboxypropyltransferase n=1 Tax=Shewanella xiamenensis TaxID=332186 RepID=UPI00313D2AC7